MDVRPPAVATACMLTLALLLAAPAGAQEEKPPPPTHPPPQQQPVQKTYAWYVGGNVGLAFGDPVSYVEFSPTVGYMLFPRFQLGGRLVYRYRRDKRFEPDLSTTELGGALFGRYYVWGPVFVHAEAERTNWEYVTQIGDGYTTVKSDYTAFYGGAGFQVPTGGRAAMYMSFLYDFNFDDNVPHPSSDPFVIRIGYGVFF
jgi:hypothetical protein